MQMHHRLGTSRNGGGTSETGRERTARVCFLTSRCELAVRHQHDFAENAACAQHLMRAARLF
jgi:hypothetical protein